MFNCKPSLQECRDTITKNNNNQHVLLSNNELDDCLRFDPLQSSLLAFTINRLASPRFQKQSLGNITNDAAKVAMAIKEKGVIRGSTFYEAKLQPDSCTFQSMKTIFQRQAQGVGREGVFIFHFSGHGIKTRNSQFGLAPIDFDFTEETYITAQVLSQWLQDAGCKAKYVLFIINSCYAGMLTEALTASNELHSYPGLYVMAACTANEISVAFNTLWVIPSFVTFFPMLLAPVNSLMVNFQSKSYMRNAVDFPLHYPHYCWVMTRHQVL